MSWQITIIAVLIGVSLVFGLFGGLIRNEAWSITFRWPSFIIAMSAVVLIAGMSFSTWRLYAVALALFIPVIRAIVVVLSSILRKGESYVVAHPPEWFDGVMYEAIGFGIAIPLIALIQGLVDLGSGIVGALASLFT